MKIISHRGNIRGSIPDKENRPSYIDCAIGNGYDVEIDVRLIEGQLWLGHDGPQYKVEHCWLQSRKEYLWIHCKDLAAAKECWEYQSFCHTSDPYTYTTAGKVWLHDLSMNINDTIIPLIDDPIIYLAQKPYAICTDYPYLLK
tara:strand:+ start:2117 stop:2545 length:429 start_codon:yes stop_codon:yes gene_type:complete